MTTNFLSTTAVLPALNILETARFYEEKLGFEIISIWKNAAKTLEFCSVRRGFVTIEFVQRKKNLIDPGICFIHIDNTDDIYREFTENQVEFVCDFDDREYAQSDFQVKDNNGNLLIFNHALSNFTPYILNDKIALNGI